MRDVLKFVSGAVSTKDVLPVLTHFAFRDQRVHGFNGRVHICAPLPAVTFNTTAPAALFMAALSEGNDDFSLALKADHVLAKCGTFKARLPIGDVGTFPAPEPPSAKQRKRVGPEIVDALKRLRPFIGDDASRPWSASIKFAGTSAYATNNVVLAATTVSVESALAVELPVQAVDEILRLAASGVVPSHCTIEREAVWFYYTAPKHLNGAWIRCTTFDGTWPEVAPVLAGVHKGAKLKKIQADQWAAAVARVRPFCPDPKHPLIVLEGSAIGTLAGTTSAQVDGFEFGGKCVFQAEPLAQVLSVAEAIDLAKFPRVPWKGSNLEGVLLGVPA
jgi:hypothetical protein